MQIQVILSLVAILGAACVALLVDYFRNKNQQLREAMVEMKVRQIEKERQLLAPAPAAAYTVTLPALKEMPAPAAELVLTSPKTADKSDRVNEKPLVRMTGESSVSDDPAGPAIDFTSRRRRRRPAVENPASGGKDEDMNSKKEFSDWLIQCAVARAHRKMAGESTAAELPESKAEERREAYAGSIPTLLMREEPVLAAPATAESSPLEADAEPVFVGAGPHISEPVDLTEPKHDQVVIEPPAINGYASKYEPVVIDEFLWKSLFESSKAASKPSPIVIASPSPVDPGTEKIDTMKRDSPVRPNQGIQVIHSVQPVELLNVPAGFHNSEALEELKNSNRPFSGLVISLGITQNDPGGAEELAQTVTAYIRTLLRESDFACRTSEDEYLLICPNLSGVAAHRHLSALSERLWDFQLRALGSFLMLFSLGGVDIQREPLADAIVSACERMSQTKRSRKAIVMLTPGQRRRKAV